jgi:hypothetical protein
MKKAISMLRIVFIVTGAVVIVRYVGGFLFRTAHYVLTMPPVHNFLMNTMLPMLGMLAIFFIFILYGTHLANLQDKKDLRDQEIKRKRQALEAAEQQEMYYHSVGMCVNCSSPIEPKYLLMQAEIARQNAERTLHTYGNLAN